VRALSARLAGQLLQDRLELIGGDLSTRAADDLAVPSTNTKYGYEASPNALAASEFAESAMIGLGQSFFWSHAEAGSSVRRSMCPLRPSSAARPPAGRPSSSSH
jgi:hypothetical protein